MANPTWFWQMVGDNQVWLGAALSLIAGIGVIFFLALWEDKRKRK